VCKIGLSRAKGEPVFDRGQCALQVTSMLYSTNYVHIKSTTVYAPRRNWDFPNPFLACECSPPPRNRGEGAHWPAGGGLGGVPIPTRGIHCGTLYMYVLCAIQPTSTSISHTVNPVVCIFDLW
jgi:hypothetical protein